MDIFDGDGLGLLLFRRLYYLYPVLDIIAGIVCLAYSRLSSRLVIAGIGFLGQVGVFMLREAIFNLELFDIDHMGLMNALLTVASLILGTLTVVGLWLAFADLSRQLFSPRRRGDWDDEDAPRPDWQRRR